MFKVGDKVKYVYNPKISIEMAKELDGLEGIVTKVGNNNLFVKCTKPAKTGIVGYEYNYSENRFQLIEKKKNPTYAECMKLL